MLYLLLLLGLYRKNSESSALCIMEVSGTEATLEMGQDLRFLYGTVAFFLPKVGKDLPVSDWLTLTFLP